MSDRPLLVLALARPTFDVPYAEEKANKAFAALDAHGVATIGPRQLLFDAEAARAAMADIGPTRLAGVLLLQVTFTDASMTVEIAKRFGEGRDAAPILIWAMPEPRAGGRLRLNAFCGLNLAAHALGRAGIAYSYLYADPDEGAIDLHLDDLLDGSMVAAYEADTYEVAPDFDAAGAGRLAADRLRSLRIGHVGEHPAGFETCRYDAGHLRQRTGAEVAPIDLATLFATAHAVPAERIAEIRAETAAHLDGLDTVDQEQLARSLAVHDALRSLASARGCGAMAVRCWPEMFTEYGCAACGPMAMLNDSKLPAACEADVYGALTAFALQEIAGEPAWLVDIVDVDSASDTAVFWHCGLAPLAMCDPEARPQAQIHSNRRMPLLRQLPLKPGRVTVARLSQAKNRETLFLATGEVLRAPMSFTGTSGVVRFDHGAGPFMDALLCEAVEHHVAMVYGDHAPAVAALGASLGLPVKELS